MQAEYIYVCRRCRHQPQFVSYNLLRAHLRVTHRITELLNSDVSMYETYPGSRFSQPPFSNDGAVGDPQPSNVDQLIQFRDEMVRAVSDSVARGFQSMPAPIVQVDMGPVVKSILDLRTAMDRSIENGVRTALVDISAQLRSIPSPDQRSITVGVNTEQDVDPNLPSTSRSTDNQLPSVNQISTGGEASAEKKVANEPSPSIGERNIENDPEKVGDTINVLAGMPSLVRVPDRAIIVPEQDAVESEDLPIGEPSAQSTL